MHSRRFSLSLATASLLAITACTAEPQAGNLDHSQYWQRVSASSATYLRGPKAQQILNRDISRCVTELRELERLGTLKDAIPAHPSGRVLDPDEKRGADSWDTPERDGHLLAEHTDYHDFDSCMRAKGWERIKYVPYDIDEEAKLNYLNHHVATRDSYTPAGKKGKSSTSSGDFDDLNE